jgi:hypothetical protein
MSISLIIMAPPLVNGAADGSEVGALDRSVGVVIGEFVRGIVGTLLGMAVSGVAGDAVVFEVTADVGCVVGCSALGL